jgi:hypothetical protein
MKHGKSVAIVGVGGIFPKSPTLEHFWANITITGNVNTARRPPEGRWLLDPDQIYDPVVGTADKVYSEKACFIDDSLQDLCLEGLDIPAEFLNELDPMFHLLLHAGRQAYLDGVSQHLERDRVGVILGNLALPSEKSSALARDYLGRTFEENLLGESLPQEGSGTAPVNRYVAGLPAGVLACPDPIPFIPRWVFPSCVPCLRPEPVPLLTSMVMAWWSAKAPGCSCSRGPRMRFVIRIIFMR